jgi:pyruvate/2-oxoglutarate dehydrogenase complex dihydrolipoamide acyltransferase (E2) component
MRSSNSKPIAGKSKKQAIFTVTNLGMFGLEEFSVNINSLEAAIFTIGAIREECIAWASYRPRL